MRSLIISNGKKTYYINGFKFFNDKNVHNGRKKAENYCLDNLLDTKEIIEFDSELECDRYVYLLELQKKNEISHLNHHVKIRVLEMFINANGDTIPEITYNVDFCYKDKQGKKHYEDVKGYSIVSDTRFEVVKSLFDYRYRDLKAYVAIIIRRNGEWLERHIGDKKKPSKLIKKQSAKIKALTKELHEKEIEENRKKRELTRLNELKQKPKLTSQERKRLEFLERKYEVPNL